VVLEIAGVVLVGCFVAAPIRMELVDPVLRLGRRPSIEREIGGASLLAPRDQAGLGLTAGPGSLLALLRGVPQRRQLGVGESGALGVADDCLELPVELGNRRRTVAELVGDDVAQHP
jgi:hypothetical protein